MESIKKNKILLSIFLLVFAVFVYFFFFSGSSSVPAKSTAVPTGPSINFNPQRTQVSGSGSATGPLVKDTANINQNDIVNILQEVNQVSIDTSLFSGTVWTNLKDFSQPVQNNAPGKQDLFAPVNKTATSLRSVSPTKK